MTSVTVITSSIGRPQLQRCAESVARQSYAFDGEVNHLVFADGPEAAMEIEKILSGTSTGGKGVDLIELPYPVGRGRWNGHLMYGAGSFLAHGSYVMFLDDDNFLENDHIATLVEAVKRDVSGRTQWAYSLRNIVTKDGQFICKDDCESLGQYPTWISSTDHLIDVNCYFLSKQLAVGISPIWNRRAREPNMMEVDRAMIATLLSNNVPGESTGKYTVNYAVEGNDTSVAADFFIKGNEEMNRRYNGVFPWRK